MSYRVNVIFSHDENGYFVYCPELPGCHSQGDTFEEAKANIREAVELYLETMNKEEIGEVLSKDLLTTTSISGNRISIIYNKMDCCNHEY